MKDLKHLLAPLNKERLSVNAKNLEKLETLVTKLALKEKRQNYLLIEPNVNVQEPTLDNPILMMIAPSVVMDTMEQTAP